MKPVYIAAYHQSVFGKLLGASVPEIVEKAVTGTCGEIGIDPAALDVASIGAACNISLNEQGLLAGLVAQVPGLAAKPIESVENACASGGQAVLSVIAKLQMGLGETGIALGYEKMRDAEGKMDGKLVGKVLGYFSHPDERAGKVFVFPHIFAEVMDAYMKAHGVRRRTWRRSRCRSTANARHNPYAQMRSVELTVDKACTIEGINRYVAEGLRAQDLRLLADHRRLRGARSRDGGGPEAAGRREEGLRAGGRLGPGDRPLRKEGRDVLRPKGAYAR